MRHIAELQGAKKPNARVNRRLPAKLVDVLLNKKLGWGAQAGWICSLRKMLEYAVCNCGKNQENKRSAKREEGLAGCIPDCSPEPGDQRDASKKAYYGSGKDNPLADFLERLYLLDTPRACVKANPDCIRCTRGYAGEGGRKAALEKRGVVSLEITHRA